MRADLFLVEKGIASSRTRAQELIAGGKVFLVDQGHRRAITKPSMNVDRTQLIEVEASESAFVSRAGQKMKGALERLAGVTPSLSVHGMSVLDIGISTGGFSDCLLQAGSKNIIGVDVGHGQLANKLRNEPRLRMFEGVNARDLSGVPLRSLNGDSGFDLIVIDVSFISLTMILPEAAQYLADSACLLALVKPQFEVGRGGLGKSGIVKDANIYSQVEEKMRAACAASGLSVEDYFESSILGSDGNREFFVFARSAQTVFAGIGIGGDCSK